MTYKGASAGKRPSDFDSEQLRRGAWIELEHTCAKRQRCSKRSKKLAQRIAMDHLTEDPRYYEKLSKIHLDGIRVRSPAHALRYGSAALAAVSFARDDWAMNFMAYTLFAFSYLPRGR